MRNSILIAVLFVVAAVNVKVVLDMNHSYDLSMVSIETLSDIDPEHGGGGSADITGPEMGAGISNASDCHKAFGYWDMALICDGSGIETTQCQIDGEITLFGFTVSGSYKKGKPYKIAWERWACRSATGNCCMADQQGLRVK